MEKIVVNTAVQQHKAVLKPFSQGEVRLYESNICVVVLPTNTFLGWRDRMVFFSPRKYTHEAARPPQAWLRHHASSSTASYSHNPHENPIPMSLSVESLGTWGSDSGNHIA